MAHKGADNTERHPLSTRARPFSTLILSQNLRRPRAQITAVVVDDRQVVLPMRWKIRDRWLATPVA